MMISYNPKTNCLSNSEVDFKLSKDDVIIAHFPNLQYEEWNETEQKFIVNIQKLKDYKKSELDKEYNSFILSKYSIEKQMKLTMYYNSLLNKQINSTLTTEEQAEKENLENLHRWYKGILQNHENDKLVIESETDIEKIKNFKASLEV